MSFSFAQSDVKTQMKEKTLLKKNTVTVVNFLTKNLQLDSKQKAICMNAYSEYANSISKGIEKVKNVRGKNPETNKMESKKQLQEYVVRFAKKRDKLIMDCLKKRQIKKFQEL